MAQRLAGCGLLCLFLAGPSALSQDPAAGFNRRHEDPGMIGTFLTADPVARNAPLLFLQQFLKRALVVLARHLQFVERILQQPSGYGVDPAETGVELYGPKHPLPHAGHQPPPMTPARS